MEPPTPGTLDHPDLGVAFNEVFTPEMREKMVRLEKENEILRRRVAESDSSSQERGGGGTVTVGTRGEEWTRIPSSSGRIEVRGDESKMVAALQQQLREKQKRVSQLEAVTQESS